MSHDEHAAMARAEFKIIDLHTRTLFTRTYSDPTAARRAAERKNLEYGAHRYDVRTV